MYKFGLIIGVVSLFMINCIGDFNLAPLTTIALEISFALITVTSILTCLVVFLMNKTSDYFINNKKSEKIVDSK